MSLQLEMTQYTSVYDFMMLVFANSFSTSVTLKEHWTEETVPTQTEELMSCRYANSRIVCRKESDFPIYLIYFFFSETILQIVHQDWVKSLHQSKMQKIHFLELAVICEASRVLHFPLFCSIASNIFTKCVWFILLLQQQKLCNYFLLLVLTIRNFSGQNSVGKMFYMFEKCN